MNDITEEANSTTLIVLPSYVSPILQQLPSNRRPNPSTVCELCPGSVWLASPKAVKCYCRVMHLVTWSTEEPNTLTHCDGMEMANMDKSAREDERAQKAENKERKANEKAEKQAAKQEAAQLREFERERKAEAKAAEKAQKAANKATKSSGA